MKKILLLAALCLLAPTYSEASSCSKPATPTYEALYLSEVGPVPDLNCGAIQADQAVADIAIDWFVNYIIASKGNEITMADKERYDAWTEQLNTYCQTNPEEDFIDALIAIPHIDTLFE